MSVSGVALTKLLIMSAITPDCKNGMIDEMAATITSAISSNGYFLKAITINLQLFLDKLEKLPNFSFVEVNKDIITIPSI